VVGPSNLFHFLASFCRCGTESKSIKKTSDHAFLLGQIHERTLINPGAFNRIEHASASCRSEPVLDRVDKLQVTVALLP